MATAIREGVSAEIEHLAHEANWAMNSPHSLEKEYAFMNAGNASLFTRRVRELLRRHFVRGDATRSGENVRVTLGAKSPTGLTHEDLEFAMTIEALRNMAAAVRENQEAVIE